jgi:hypothetical protein
MNCNLGRKVASDSFLDWHHSSPRSIFSFTRKISNELIIWSGRWNKYYSHDHTTVDQGPDSVRCKTHVDIYFDNLARHTWVVPGD